MPGHSDKPLCWRVQDLRPLKCCQSSCTDTFPFSQLASPPTPRHLAIITSRTSRVSPRTFCLYDLSNLWQGTFIFYRVRSSASSAWIWEVQMLINSSSIRWRSVSDLPWRGRPGELAKGSLGRSLRGFLQHWESSCGTRTWWSPPLCPPSGLIVSPGPHPLPLGHVCRLCCVWLFCNPVDCSLTGSSVLGILQARLLQWVAISFSGGSSLPRDQTQVSCIGRHILYHWATWKPLPLGQRLSKLRGHQNPGGGKGL